MLEAQCEQLNSLSSKKITMKKIILFSYFFLIAFISFGQVAVKTMLRLPDTGEITSYTSTFGEDADYSINVPFFTINGNGTVTDTVTGLMWQQTDGGEMTIENAVIYCDTLTLGGYTDWRLPSAHEAFGILNLQYANPALDATVFTTTDAEYWWTSTFQANDNTFVWVTNSGGGIGNHPKSETVSAGGIKRFHVIAVRDITTPSVITNHFTDNGNGTITDNLTNLVWQKTSYADTITWEQTLVYADTLSLTGTSDWRLPNIKELQSINDESLVNPSVNTNFFSNIGVKKYWSSTTLPNQTTKAWYFDTQFGITTYDTKTIKHNLICVRGNQNNTSAINENTKKDLITIAPNPAATYINISSPLQLVPIAIEIEIVDIHGQLIKSITTDKAHTIIDISSFAKGIYFLKLKTGKNISVKKFIKQ
jgi:hypothetical protein